MDLDTWDLLGEWTKARMIAYCEAKAEMQGHEMVEHERKMDQLRARGR
jgi:hypothetical protein